MADLQKALDAIIENDFKRAIKLLLPLSKNGNASAQFYMSSLYFNGLGVIEDQKEADKLLSNSIKIFKEQAENSNKEAVSRLGRILADGVQLKYKIFRRA